jgi:hypothetical protein
MSIKNRTLALQMLLFICLLTPMANCLDTETLWNECDLAALGTVESITNSIGNIQNGEYFRVVEIKVESYYISELDESKVKIRVEGDDTHVVEDQPEFTIGEHVFVFLQIPEKITGDYDYEVFGMYQGKWTVENSTAIRGDQSFKIPEKASSLIEREWIDGYQTLLAVIIIVISLIFLILYKLIIK